MKEKIKELLLSTKRNGMPQLVEALEKGGYFQSPASARFHLCCERGLIMHSYSVYTLFKEMIEKFDIGLPNDSIIIVSLLHDVCKVGAYKKKGNSYFWNKEQPVGHTLLSLTRIKKFIELTDDEEKLIKYHMGYYGSKEFNSLTGEYSLMQLTQAYNLNKIAKLFYFCDDMSAQFLERKDGIVFKDDK